MCVVGAGVAGLFLAANLSETLRVLVLEKTKKTASKLLLTGGGRCNYTHSGDAEELLRHYNRAGKRFLKPSLNTLNGDKLISMFDEMGVASSVDSDGKIFPASNRSADVLSALTRRIRARGHRIIRESPVVAVTASSKDLFEIRCDSGLIFSKHVVLATGGCSYPATGSSGDGFVLARELGHKIIEPEPALTDLRIYDFCLSELAGVTLREAGLVLKRKGETVTKRTGQVLITHLGFSGPAVLNISGHVQPGDCLTVSFTMISEEELKRFLINASSESGSKHLISVLSQLEISRSLLLKLCEFCEIDHAKHISQMTREERKEITSTLCSMKFRVESKGGFDSAMVTRGGVSLDEVNPKTMESKLVKGLYFCGEILDIDGETGGYNLHAAFATAYLAARDIARS